MSDPRRVFYRLLAPYENQLSFGPRLLESSPKYVSARVQVDLFQIEILHIESQIGNAPCDPIVVTDDHSWQPGK